MTQSLLSSAKLGLVLFLITAVVMSGLAFAQSGSDDVLTDQARSTDQAAEPPRPHLRAAVSEVLLDAFGMDRAELADAVLQAGSVAAAAEANGIPVADLAAQLEAMAAERIAAADAAGLIDATDETYQKAADRVAEFLVVDSADLPIGRRADARLRFADLVGLSVDEVRHALDEGATLLELVEGAGYSVDGFVADFIAPLQARADQAVADGLIDVDGVSDRIDAVTDRITDRITDRVTDRATDRITDRVTDRATDRATGTGSVVDAK